MIQLICGKQQSLKQFTDENCAQASFCFSRLLKEKEIKVNGKKVGADTPLFVGDIVQYFMTEKQANKPAFSLVYEDENIFIVDKESGVNSEAVFAELSRKEGGMVAFIHRLDRNTSGLLAFARNEKSEKELLSAFQNRKVDKRYHAVCFGAPKKEKDILTAYLKKDENRALVQIFDKQKVGAERIVTEYTVIEKRVETTKLEIALHTGKTHQIRAHLAHIGCPIVGDMKYGNTEKNRALQTTRQQLVAKYLRFSFDGALSYLNEKSFVSKFEV